MTRVNGGDPRKGSSEPVSGTQMAGAPVPVMVSIDSGEMVGAEGTLKFVLITMQSSNGLFNFFVSPDQADEIAGHLTTHAREARTGLVIASPSDVPPAPPGS